MASTMPRLALPVFKILKMYDYKLGKIDKYGEMLFIIHMQNGA